MNEKQPPVDKTPPVNDESGDQPEEGPFDWMRRQVAGDAKNPDSHWEAERLPTLEERLARDLERSVNTERRN